FCSQYFKGGQFTENVSARGKVAVVTGGNTGLGLETVKELNLRGAKVYMLCRSELRAAEAKEVLVKSGCDASRLIYVNCDLSSMDNVRKCAAQMTQNEQSIDILVNNAGVRMPDYQKSVDGHEMTWATNYLGPFLLTELLLPAVEKAPEGRIVNVASRAHARCSAINLSTIDDNNASYNASDAYGKSKLANMMHARELNRRLREKENTTVTVNSLHPGNNNNIINDISDFLQILASFSSSFLKSWKDGSQTSLYCALSTEVKGVTGQYFSDCARKEEAPLARDDLACKQLYDYSRKAVGL
ncbi:hypothetical protein PENTCL1PPCAC_29098, partial [Pristionchus entomophagus]